MEGSGKVQKHLGCVQEASGMDSEVRQLVQQRRWLGTERFNQEHKTHSEYDHLRASGESPHESWKSGNEEVQ